MFGKSNKLNVLIGFMAMSPETRDHKFATDDKFEEYLESIGLKGVEKLSKEELKVGVEELYGEFSVAMDSFLVGNDEYIPFKTNKLMFDVLREIDMGGIIAFSSEELNDIKSALDFSTLDEQLVHPCSSHTLAYLIDVMFDKLMRVETTDTEWFKKHSVRFCAYTTLFETYAQARCNRTMDVAMEEVIAEPSQPEIIQTEASAEMDTVMDLVDGLECLVMGYEPTGRGANYTKGVLEANNMYNVFGGEGLWDSVKEAAEKVWKSITNGVKAFFAWFKKKDYDAETKTLKEKTEDNINALVAKVKELKGDLVDKVKVEAMISKLKEMGGSTSKLVSSLTAFAKSTPANISSTYKKVVEATVAWSDECKKNTKAYDVCQTKLGELKKAMSALQSGAGAANEYAKDKASQAKAALQAKIKEVKETYKEAKAKVSKDDSVFSRMVSICKNPSSLIKSTPAAA